MSKFIIKEVSIMMTDTGSRQNEKEFFHNYRKLEVQNKNLVKLASCIAHEAVNPLANILMWSEVMQEKLKQNQQVNFELDTIMKVAEHGSKMTQMLLHNLGDNMLSLEKEDMQVFSIAQIANQAVSFYPFTPEQRQRVNVNIGCDFSFYGSDTLIHHVLLNLLKNVAYYMHDNTSATVNISTMEGASVNKLYFTDDACGIAADKQTIIFNEFVSLDKRYGSGLGLSFCKQAMQAIGGDIVCDSQLGKYTTFILSFPNIKTKIDS